MELGWVEETGGRAAADALVANHARLVEAEATEFVLAAHWADLHDAGSLVGGEGSGRVNRHGFSAVLMRAAALG